jgi:multidrug efflux pump subunit AcrA (membrane-fusion protein)
VGPDSRAQERKVETGEIIRSSVEILSGLRPREKVITVGASMLADGELIDARPVEPSHKP